MNEKVREAVKETVRTVLQLAFATQPGGRVNLVIRQPKLGLTQDAVDAIGELIAKNKGIMDAHNEPVVMYKGAKYTITSVKALESGKAAE